MRGNHTFKVGFYAQKSLKDQSGFGANNGQIEFTEDSANQFDTTFPFANAATGVFRFYDQASIYPIGAVPLLEHRVVCAGQLEADGAPDPRRRHPLLLGAAAVRPGDADRELRARRCTTSSRPCACIVPASTPPAARRRRYGDRTDSIDAAFIGRIVPNSGDLANGLRTGESADVGKYLIKDNGASCSRRASGSPTT